jgi:hypothetical protein
MPPPLSDSGLIIAEPTHIKTEDKSAPFSAQRTVNLQNRQHGWMAQETLDASSKNDADLLKIRELEEEVSKLQADKQQYAEDLKTKDELLKLFEGRARKDQQVPSLPFSLLFSPCSSSATSPNPIPVLQGVEAERDKHHQTVQDLRATITTQQSHVTALRKELLQVNNSVAEERRSRLDADENLRVVTAALEATKVEGEKRLALLGMNQEEVDAQTKVPPPVMSTPGPRESLLAPPA